MSRYTAAFVALAAALFVGVPVTAQSQGSGGTTEGTSSRWFPAERLFSPLLAAPREVGFRGSFILADRDVVSDFPGRNIEAEVVLGHTFPVYLISPGDDDSPAITLNFEVATFSRFFMERSTKDLIGTDFRVGIPIEFRQGEWSARVNFRHISDHFGDDFVVTFGTRPITSSKEGIEAILAKDYGQIRVYSGGEYNLHINSAMARAAARAGVEWDGSRASHRPSTWVFGAGDFRYSSFSERVSGTFSAGVGVRLNDRDVLFEARAHFGPTALGQFREQDETFFGLGLRINP